MQKILRKIRESKGFVSIEVIVVAGLVIAFGIITYSAFEEKGAGIANGALEKMDAASNSAIPRP